MSGFGSLQPRTGNKDSVKLDEVITVHKWTPDKWDVARFLPGKIISVKRHWIKILGGKEKKEITIPRYCLAHDPNDESKPRMMPNPNYVEGSKKAKEKDEFIPIPCPYCTLTHGNDQSGASARAEFFYLANAIIREIQEEEPRKKDEHTKSERKTGFKDIRSKSWTPVRVCRLVSSMAARIQELGEGNIVKDKESGKKKAFDVTHEKYGIDIRVKFKPKAAGTDKYSLDKDERTPLSKDEKAYLIWELDDKLLDVTGRMDLKQANEDFKRMEIVGGDTPDDDDEDGYTLGDDDDAPKGKKSGKKKKPFEDDDDDEDDDAPKKSKKSKKKVLDDDDDDDDEDDKPKKSSKSKSKDKAKSKDKPVKKKKKSSDDDDDEPKKKSKSSKKDKAEKPAKKSKDKPKKGKKKPSVWDDDE